ncbi:MAG: hypothetical protein GY809_14570, partial [Planctomycetes bacterium]|nr:hypothetical protein [Planctomycetota bacterium]
CFSPNHGEGGIIEVEGWIDGAAAELAMLINDVSPVEDEWQEVDLPAWVPLSTMARRYLEGRGITEETIRYCGIVEQAETPRVIIPFKGPQGKLIGATGRAYMSTIDHEPKYLNLAGSKCPFVLPQWDRFDNAVLVEGPMDALMVWQATGLPVIALGGVTISRRMDWDLSQLVKGKLFIMLDGAAVGNSIKLFNQLMDRYTCDIIPLPYKKDPGDLTPKEIRTL